LRIDMRPQSGSAIIWSAANSSPFCSATARRRTLQVNSTPGGRDQVATEESADESAHSKS
jgi:hypothetical protein